ncbi:heparinase II/III family protein [Saccharicrinis sp. FJH62]|uniref:heparinase II/III domain-containing protein n=1 Tax=Saccharicrinis sp. FJH62 TaxID=3344657 RepID=UPI0035D43C73
MYKTIILITLFCLSVIHVQARNYLFHTNANIQKLKAQIRTSETVEAAWKAQLNRADQLSMQDKNGSRDCQELGLVYRMTGEVKYAEVIKRILLDYTARETWEGRDLLNRIPPWIAGLGTSHTSFDIALGYDCIYDYLSTRERQQIAEGFVRVGIEPALHDWLNPLTNQHTFDTMGHNWWSACVYTAGLSSVAVRDEIPEAEDWLEEISATTPEWLNYAGSVLQNKPPTFDKDGGCYEGINYTSYGISQYLLYRYAFSNVFPDKQQPELPILDKIADFFIYTTYYTSEGPMSVNFGDGNLSRNGNACITLLWDMGYQEDRYAWYLNQMVKGSDREALQLNTPVGLILYPRLPRLDESYVPELPDAHLYADMGWATVRDSWDDNATMLAVKSGFTWNHAHADANSFILFHKGKNLIMDSGNSSYGNPLYTQYYCQSVAQNVVLWNGKAQREKDQYYGVIRPGKLYNLIDGKNFKYLLADATGPTALYFARNYRSFIWVGDVILIIDDLLSHEPGQFEWLLHYNGESERHGLDLSIKEDGAEVLVHPLFPETFPDGGLPHDFPEKMRLEERQGYADHHPEKKVSYWSVSQNKITDRTKLINAIILKDNTNKDNLPLLERFEGKNFLGVRITQNGQITEVYLNLLADGRIKHRNSVIDMNGWSTDTYLLAVSYKQNEKECTTENIDDLFMAHGSYLRRDYKVLAHALSKYTMLVEDFNGQPHVTFHGQPDVNFQLHQKHPDSDLSINGNTVRGEYNKELKTVNVKIE